MKNNELDNKIKEIDKYFQKYLKLIGSDHHKSRDGVGSINFDYDGYDDNQNTYVWSVEHNGYINSHTSVGNNLESLLDGFLEEIKNWIKDYGKDI